MSMKRPGKGQSLVETALMLPVLLLLLTGIIDFGLLFNSYLVVSNAAREGARFAAVGNTDTEIITKVGNAAASLDLARLQTVITPVESVRNPGDSVTVTVRYGYSMITPVIGAFFPDEFNIETSTTMRCE